MMARRTSVRRAKGERRLLIMQHRGVYAPPAFIQLARGRRRGGLCERSAGDGERDEGGPTLCKLVPR